ncbi:MAG: 3'-5' exoribonuclease YhaM family protein [Candidatus Izemoplasmataceae bacterium]
METFKLYAKVDSINETTYETNTMSVLDKDNVRHTLRINEDEVLEMNQVYMFILEPIVFKERDQYLVHEFTKLDDVELSLKERQELMTYFYEYAPVSSEEIKTIIDAYLAKLENKIIREIVMDIFQKNEQDFYLYPAATKFHHAYIGGLSYHTSTMLKLLDGFLNVYPFLNQDLLIAGVILHDVCKVKELSNYAGPEYTKEGKMIGHINMGVKEIALTAAKLGYLDTEEELMLEHIVLSHHYYGNFGSPKKPMLPEALILHFIDNIDSKVTVLEEALSQISEGEFTPSIPVVDRERFYKPKFNK